MVPANPQIFHIVHLDRLRSIASDGWLLSDSRVGGKPGTTIGMTEIKKRRLTSGLESHPGLHVGDCVPFYFCPRSVMLYLLHKGNHPELTYRDGQDPIVHLRIDLNAAVAWADANRHRWAFTLTNAGSNYFEDRADLGALAEINWDAVAATSWSQRDYKEGKQAEFLIEGSMPWSLVATIGTRTEAVRDQVAERLRGASHTPRLIVRPDWYY